MPLYEYFCPDCAACFDLRRGIDQRDAPAQCPICQATHSVRHISLPIAFAHAEGSQVRAIGGSPCGGCVARSCGGCSLRPSFGLTGS
jgi:putative FmdB family regulatory protein